MGAFAEKRPRADVVSDMKDNMESLSGVTADSMADEAITHAKEFGFSNTVDGLAQVPLLVLSANDGLAPSTNALVDEITLKGSKKVTSIHIGTDHGWSDHRIFLESTIINWLAGLN